MESGSTSVYLEVCPHRSPLPVGPSTITGEETKYGHRVTHEYTSFIPYLPLSRRRLLPPSFPDRTRNLWMYTHSTPSPRVPPFTLPSPDIPVCPWSINDGIGGEMLLRWGRIGEQFRKTQDRMDPDLLTPRVISERQRSDSSHLRRDQPTPLPRLNLTIILCAPFQ